MRSGSMGMAAALAVATCCRAADIGDFARICSEEFGAGAAGRWFYDGATNAAGQPLFRVDASSGNVTCQWDEALDFDTNGVPYKIVASRLSRPLGTTLTDRDTFRVGATLRIAPGSVPDTTEFYEIANIGLYNTNTMGPDRCMSDNWSGNAIVVKDACDFVEFNYFISNINDTWGAPNITCVIGAHIEGTDGDYTTGTDWTQTAMGLDHWLPEGADLYVEVIYYGAAEDDLGRRAVCTIYTEPARTNVLKVNGVSMRYWTQPLPAGKTFTVTDVGFYNYVNGPLWGIKGEGRGTWDDVYVDVAAFPHGLKPLVEEDFDAGDAGWQYEGGTNKDGLALFRRNAGAGNVDAEWDQSNLFDGGGDPYMIEPSRYSRPLGRAVTDQDTFRVRATLRLTPGTVPDTTEFYPIAAFGLYNAGTMGADRMMDDSYPWKPPYSKVKDGCDFVDFNYLVNNKLGPHNATIASTIGAHIEGVDGDYTAGAAADRWFFHDTDMGADHRLPEGTNLYVELVYFGWATNGLARRAYSCLYSDAARKSVLRVNGAPMCYWTRPLPAGRTFAVTDFAFYNYAAANAGGANGAGAGTWDDVSVELLPSRILKAGATADGFVMEWTSMPGRTYRVLMSADLKESAWATNATVTAGGYVTCHTNGMGAGGAFYSVAF